MNSREWMPALVLVALSHTFMADAASKIAAPSVNNPSVTKSNWLFSDKTDSMTDAHYALAVADSDNDEAVFIMQCDKPGPNDMYLMVRTRQYLGGSFDKRLLVLRFDSDPPIQTLWSYNNDYAFLEPTDPLTPTLYQKALTAKRVTVRAYTYGSEPVEFSASLSGAQDAYRKVQQVCHDTALAATAGVALATAPDTGTASTETAPTVTSSPPVTPTYALYERINTSHPHRPPSKWDVKLPGISLETCTALGVAQSPNPIIMPHGDVIRVVFEGCVQSDVPPVGYSMEIKD